MSAWGHFAGIIRVAKDPLIAPRQKGILKKVFTSNGKFPFPAGSEGPIKSQIIASEWEYTIVLHGDIRGVEKKELLYAKYWWKIIEEELNKSHINILQSILSINMDYDRSTTILEHKTAMFKEEK